MANGCSVLRTFVHFFPTPDSSLKFKKFCRQKKMEVTSLLNWVFASRKEIFILVDPGAHRTGEMRFHQGSPGWHNSFEMHSIDVSNSPKWLCVHTFCSVGSSNAEVHSDEVPDNSSSKFSYIRNVLEGDPGEINTNPR